MIEEKFNAQERVTIYLSPLGGRWLAERERSLTDQLVIYQPNAVAKYAIYLRGGWQRSLTAYVDDNGALRFGRLVIPLYAHQIAAQPQNWLQAEVGYFDAGRMLAYCRNRNWTWHGGVDSLAQAWAEDASAARLGDILKEICS